MGFSKNLCFLMAEKNVSKYRLAKDIDCSQSSVKNWRDGTVIPHPRARQKIADYFGITLAELDGDELPTLPEKVAKKTPTDKIDERVLDANLIKRLVRLTPDELRRVDDFVQGILAFRKE